MSIHSTENTSPSTPETASTSTLAAPKPSVKKAVRKAAPKRPAKSAQKTTAKAVKSTANQPASKAASQTKAKPEPKAKPVAAPKLKKPKLVRDSFTFPKDEYQAIAALKQKALSLQHSVKKSEILRAGLKLMSSLNDKAFLAALSNVPALKTGRPAKS
jgi:hypothetical protein